MMCFFKMYYIPYQYNFVPILHYSIHNLYNLLIFKCHSNYLKVLQKLKYVGTFIYFKNFILWLY